MKRVVKIFLADDHKLMLEGLATLLESIDDFHVTARVGSGKELIDALNKAVLLPDLCIVDIEMPGLDGIETVKLLRQQYPKLKLMTLTMHNEWHFVNRAIASGANGYMLKNSEREAFIDAIHRIMDGDEFVTMGMTPKTRAEQSILTDREKEILQLIVQGKSNKEIAADLFISDRTADTHRTNIKKKLSLSSLSQLIAYAKEHDLLR